jgi:hypothetical protein
VSGAEQNCNILCAVGIPSTGRLDNCNWLFRVEYRYVAPILGSSSGPSHDRRRKQYLALSAAGVPAPGDLWPSLSN